MKTEEHLQGIVDCVVRKRARAAKVCGCSGRGLAKCACKQATPDDEDDLPGTSEDEDDEQNPVEKSIVVDIAKASEEEQTVTGIVLQPEVVDGQGDIMSSDVIKESAYNFLAGFNATTKLGLQHSTFPKGKLALVESYLAPMNFVLGSKTVKQGSWVMTVKVLDAALWKKVKEGKITGFSIGGRAKVIAAEAT